MNATSFPHSHIQDCFSLIGKRCQCLIPTVSSMCFPGWANRSFPPTSQNTRDLELEIIMPATHTISQKQADRRIKTTAVINAVGHNQTAPFFFLFYVIRKTPCLYFLFLGYFLSFFLSFFFFFFGIDAQISGSTKTENRKDIRSREI